MQRQVLTRAVSFVGYPYVWGGTSEAPQQPFGKPTPGGFDCSGFVWRVFKLEPFPGASALASVLRGRTTYQMSGEVPPAQRIRKAENLQPGDLIFQGDGRPEVEAGPGRSRGDLPRRRLVRALVRKRHHPASVRRVVPRPVRVGPAAAARSRALLARSYERGGDVVQVAERLVRDAERVEMGREGVAREDAVRGERGAAVRVAVARRRRTARPRGCRACTARRRSRTPPRRGIGRSSRPGRTSTRLASTSSWTPSRASTGSISSWKPAEITSGSMPSASSCNPSPHLDVLDHPATTSSSGAVIASNSSAISSCSVRSTPTRGSSSASSAGSPNSWITCTSESRTVIVPSQSTTSLESSLQVLR